MSNSRKAFVAAMAMAAGLSVIGTDAQSQSPNESAPSAAASGLPYFTSSPTAGGWSFEASPYLWMASVKKRINAPTPGGGVATTDVSTPFSDLLKNLRMAAMFAAEARYDRVSFLTDIMYVNLGLHAGAARISSVNPGSGRIDIPTQMEVSVGAGIGTTIWTLGAAYTLVSGPWGNLDALVGARYLGVDMQASYSLTAAIMAPNHTIALARSGDLGAGAGYWDAIGGVRGHFNVPNSQFFVPFYFDVGSGELPLTWQAFTGVGYRTSRADLSLGYRYLDFRDNGSARVSRLEMGGPMMVASFRF